ncbi:gamma-aminobutyric acid type B receptor subunit 1-like [Heptranchias perlo]|uniref:gamma-aminobutyric acid type B receptor subunit 1-like n=1 Tax=Heptranchias perlo TaxID=212740 RepID=UPI00355AC4E7
MGAWILLLLVLIPSNSVSASQNGTTGCRKIRPPSDGGIRYPGLTQEQIRLIEFLPVAYEIEYICRSNRAIVGPRVRKCLHNGMWTDMEQRSRCVRNCSKLALNLENGYVMTRDRTKMPVEGTLVEYRCDAGFILVGSSRSICTKYGKWNNSKPTCQGKGGILANAACRNRFTRNRLRLGS